MIPITWIGTCLPVTPVALMDVNCDARVATLFALVYLASPESLPPVINTTITLRQDLVAAASALIDAIAAAFASSRA